MKSGGGLWILLGVVPLGWCTTGVAVAQAVETVGLEVVSAEYARTARPLLAKYCLECHSAELKEGDLDLERFASLDDVRQATRVWLKVAEMLDSREMPPKEARRMSPGDRQALRAWLARY